MAIKRSHIWGAAAVSLAVGAWVTFDEDSELPINDVNVDHDVVSSSDDMRIRDVFAAMIFAPVIEHEIEQQTVHGYILRADLVTSTSVIWDDTKFFRHSYNGVSGCLEGSVAEFMRTSATTAENITGSKHAIYFQTLDDSVFGTRPIYACPPEKFMTP